VIVSIDWPCRVKKLHARTLASLSQRGKYPERKEAPQKGLLSRRPFRSPWDKAALL